MGGRNQRTQVCLRVWTTGPCGFAVVGRLNAPSLALFSAAGVFAPATTEPKSKEPPETPGVFGALPGAPNDAKAPLPKPKAEEAPTVGDGMAGEARGMELNGLPFEPWEDKAP